MTDKRDAAAREAEDLWVFAYGSLVWNPGFEPAERRPACLRGFRRAFAMRSIHHRGTEEAPGLVLALDYEEGAACDGLALRVRTEEARKVMEALRERELISSAYLERRVRLDTDRGEIVAVAFVVDREHPQYAGGLPEDVQAEIIARARGGRGPNDEYLHKTARALHDAGIGDAALDRLSEKVRRFGDNPANALAPPQS